jgi:hypothetical protein
MLDFHRYTDWFAVEMPSPAGSTAPQVDAHELHLTD